MLKFLFAFSTSYTMAVFTERTSGELALSPVRKPCPCARARFSLTCCRSSHLCGGSSASPLLGILFYLCPFICVHTWKCLSIYIYTLSFSCSPCFPPLSITGWFFFFVPPIFLISFKRAPISLSVLFFLSSNSALSGSFQWPCARSKLFQPLWLPCACGWETFACVFAYFCMWMCVFIKMRSLSSSYSSSSSSSSSSISEYI